MKKNIKISFCRRLYSLAAIKEAVAAFAEAGRFKVKEQKDNILVEIDEVSKDMGEALEREFCNWVLFFMKG